VSRNFLRATTAKQTAAGLLAVCSVGSCLAAGVLDPQGPVGSAERLILLNSTAIMLVVVVPVIVLTLVFACWYRASNNRAAYFPRVVLFRAYRVCSVVDTGDGSDSAGGSRMDRLT
jgi:hypothetical protein